MGNELLKIYFDNDLEAIQKVSKNALKETSEKDFLVKERNDGWMKLLPVLLKKGSQFIAVSPLHLAGPNGLREQLKNQGFRVNTLK